MFSVMLFCEMLLFHEIVAWFDLQGYCSMANVIHYLYYKTKSMVDCVQSVLTLHLA